MVPPPWYFLDIKAWYPLHGILFDIKHGTPSMVFFGYKSMVPPPWYFFGYKSMVPPPWYFIRYKAWYPLHGILFDIKHGTPSMVFYSI